VGGGIVILAMTLRSIGRADGPVVPVAADAGSSPILLNARRIT
jgi:hypothetical protein